MSRISLFPVCFDHVNITVNAPVPVNIKWSDPLASQIRDGRVAPEIRSYRNRWNRGQTRTPSTKSDDSILSHATRSNKRSFTAQGRLHHRELTISVTTHRLQLSRIPHERVTQPRHVRTCCSRLEGQRRHSLTRTVPATTAVHMASIFGGGSHPSKSRDPTMALCDLLIGCVH